MLGKLFGFAVIGLALSALGNRVCAAATDGREASYSNSLSAEERAAGWKLLFDGKTMEGWREYRKTGLSPKWHVADGAMTFEDSGRKEGLGIVSAEQYDNFELILEWKIEKGTNSGLMYRVSESEAKPYATGPEYQILDDAAYPKELSKRQCGSCYDMYTPAMQAAKPPGQWNRTRLVVNGNHVEHWLNGDKIVEYDFHSTDWNDRRKSSKWKDYPKYGSEPKGYICLQEHGSTVSFRSIKIRPLPAAG
jgi:hypothetical protein